ncbi:MAG: hypothetical protein NT023_11715 [Armatimonadetes bacterium]|nr:hypothetical protein [Armatimonadota bacterium]
MLSILLDENISHIVAEQVRQKQPQMFIESLHKFQGGVYRGTDDAQLLSIATEVKLTLITYDLQTIPDLLTEWSQEGIAHADVVFVDRHTIGSHDLGRLVRAILRFWEQNTEFDWTNRTAFLPAP